MAAYSSLLFVSLNIGGLLEISSVSQLFDDLFFLTFLDELADHLFMVTSTLSCGDHNIRTLASTHY
jgi:hypothetical protein